MEYTIEEINNFINDIAVKCASQESCVDCPFLRKDKDNRCTFSTTPWLWQSIKEN